MDRTCTYSLFIFGLILRVPGCRSMCERVDIVSYLMYVMVCTCYLSRLHVVVMISMAPIVTVSLHVATGQSHLSANVCSLPSSRW